MPSDGPLPLHALDLPKQVGQHSTKAQTWATCPRAVPVRSCASSLPGNRPCKPYGHIPMTYVCSSQDIPGAFAVNLHQPLQSFCEQMRQVHEACHRHIHGLELYIKYSDQQKISELHPDLADHIKSAPLSWAGVLPWAPWARRAEHSSPRCRQTLWLLCLLRLQQTEFPGAWARPLYASSSMPASHLCLTCNITFSIAFHQTVVAIPACTLFQAGFVNPIVTPNVGVTHTHP